jgi:hypothetical protein
LRRHVTGFPSLLCSVLDVSHVLDGFLLHEPGEFISPHRHVRDFPSGVCPSRTAVQARRLPLPSSFPPAPCR